MNGRREIQGEGRLCIEEPSLEKMTWGWGREMGEEQGSARVPHTTAPEGCAWRETEAVTQAGE